MFYDLKFENKIAFSLVEVLIVIFILAILASLTIIGLGAVRSKGRDAKRIADVKQIQTALELYLLDNASYPTSWAPGQPLIDPTGNKTYFKKMPSNPSPQTEGSCLVGTDYSYSTSTNGYIVNYCLAYAVGSVGGGSYMATPVNMAISTACSQACTGTTDTCTNAVCMCGTHAACNTGDVCTAGLCYHAVWNWTYLGAQKVVRNCVASTAAGVSYCSNAACTAYCQSMGMPYSSWSNTYPGCQCSSANCYALDAWTWYSNSATITTSTYNN